jgi:2-polyprenyl-3-methyl-5-hydroxy-6-metoxy-1,4-benzoquinol methylase
MSSALKAHTFFNNLYARNPDPWAFETSKYEHAKYGATLAAVSGRRFRSAIEVGCSIGVLTEKLGSRCHRLLAVDLAASALEQARRRCSSAHHIEFRQCAVPGEWPEGRFDLILLSEVLYFLTPSKIRRTAQLAASSLMRGGVIVLVNYLGPNGRQSTGANAAATFIAAITRSKSARAFSRSRPRRHWRYRLDVLRF